MSDTWNERTERWYRKLFLSSAVHALHGARNTAMHVDNHSEIDRLQLLLNQVIAEEALNEVELTRLDNALAEAMRATR